MDLIKIRAAIALLQNIKHARDRVLMNRHWSETVDNLITDAPRKIIVDAINELTAAEDLLQEKSTK